MNIQQLKEALKPLIRDLIKEVLLEEKGVLSHIIKESLSVMPERDISFVSSEQRQQANEEKMFNKNLSVNKSSLADKDKQKIKEVKSKLMEAIGKDAYNGVNLFEGTKPLTKGGNPENNTQAVSPLANIEPDDPGVPIDKIFENTQIWGKIAAGTKKKNK